MHLAAVAELDFTETKRLANCRKKLAECCLREGLFLSRN